MQIITTNSPEHRDLIIQALNEYEIHLLQQLQEARESMKPLIKLLESFEDDLIHSSYSEPNPEEFTIIKSKEYYDFLTKN